MERLEQRGAERAVTFTGKVVVPCYLPAAVGSAVCLTIRDAPFGERTVHVSVRSSISFYGTYWISCCNNLAGSCKAIASRIHLFPLLHMKPHLH